MTTLTYETIEQLCTEQRDGFRSLLEKHLAGFVQRIDYTPQQQRRDVGSLSIGAGKINYTPSSASPVFYG